jgi:hypothetical protein
MYQLHSLLIFTLGLLTGARFLVLGSMLIPSMEFIWAICICCAANCWPIIWFIIIICMDSDMRLTESSLSALCSGTTTWI